MDEASQTISLNVGEFFKHTHNITLSLCKLEFGNLTEFYAFRPRLHHYPGGFSHSYKKTILIVRGKRLQYLWRLPPWLLPFSSSYHRRILQYFSRLACYTRNLLFSLFDDVPEIGMRYRDVTTRLEWNRNGGRETESSIFCGFRIDR